KYPQTVDTLLRLADIKVRAAPWGIKTIIRREPDVIFTFDAEVKRLEPLFSGATGKTSFPDPQTLYWRLPEQYFRGDTLLSVLRNLSRRGAGESDPQAPAPGDEPQASARDPRDASSPSHRPPRQPARQ